MERGLIGVIFKEVWMARNFCNNLSAVEFVYKFQNDASRLAQQVNVPTENILGLAAEESQYGAGRIATTINNYFSMHAPAPLQIGEEPAHGNPSVKVAKFNSFYQSGQSFIAIYGSSIRNLSDPAQFGKALVRVNFNPGDAARGGRTGFVEYLAEIIEVVKLRMGCR